MSSGYVRFPSPDEKIHKSEMAVGTGSQISQSTIHIHVPKAATNYWYVHVPGAVISN